MKFEMVSDLVFLPDEDILMHITQTDVGGKWGAGIIYHLSRECGSIMSCIDMDVSDNRGVSNIYF